MTLDVLQSEIRSLPREERKRLVGFIIDTLDEPSEETPQAKRDILEFEGVGAEMWSGIDAQESVNRLRDEWDQN